MGISKSKMGLSLKLAVIICASYGNDSLNPSNFCLSPFLLLFITNKFDYIFLSLLINSDKYHWFIIKSCHP